MATSCKAVQKFYFRLIPLQSEAKICEKIINDVIIRYIIAGHNPQKAYLQTPTPRGCVCGYKNNPANAFRDIINVNSGHKVVGH